MKRIRNLALLAGLVLGLTRELPAQSKLSGTFVYPLNPSPTAICGSIRCSVSDGQVAFQSTMFQVWTSDSSLEPVLLVQGVAIPFLFGTGIPGSWELGEFLGDYVPGINPPPGIEPIDPGFAMPVYSAGMRYSGSFTVAPELVAALLAGEGTLQMQIHGSPDLGGLSVQDPLIAAVLVPVPEPSTAALLALGSLPFFIRRKRK